MKRLGRIVLWFLAGLLAVSAVLAAPVVYVETQCQGEGAPSPTTPLGTETRPAVRTLLTYPEWHIVHAYDDYAAVITQGDPHDFGYARAVIGYWRALCTVTRASATLGEIDTPTRQMVHVIGVSFSVEMAFKAAYEETVGRMVTWVRGAERAALDALSARQAAEYAAFLQQVPWYRYDFRADAAALSAARQGGLRDTERWLALGLEHRVRAAYAGLIGAAVAATGFDDLTGQMILSAPDPQAVARVEGVRILRQLDAQTVEVETPRYRALTHLLQNWAQDGADFIQIAGNDTILFTAISAQPSMPGAFLSLPRQGHGDTRHLFLVPVRDLAEQLRGLDARGLRLEHIHDY